MKFVLLILISTYPLSLFAEEFAAFEDDELSKGQCGCWYYHPFKDGLEGNVIGLGKAANESILFKLNGKKIEVGNWKAQYKKRESVITYKNEKYEVHILSKTLKEERYSSSYQSMITISNNKEKHIIEAYGACGC